MRHFSTKIICCFLAFSNREHIKEKNDTPRNNKFTLLKCYGHLNVEYVKNTVVRNAALKIVEISLINYVVYGCFVAVNAH